MNHARLTENEFTHVIGHCGYLVAKERGLITICGEVACNVAVADSPGTYGGQIESGNATG